MQETEFILQNKDKWKEFEEVLTSANKDPERLTDLFIETTDDLSYSRTYYPNRSVRVYLNGIAQQIYQAIYKNKQREKNTFAKFWREELPEAMWHSRKALLYSFLLFAAGITVGIVSSMYYPEFARIILGDGYIEMTKANIEQGDPMAVYKQDEPVGMFFQIAWNNIMIAYGTFVLGILFGIGTIYIVFYNAIMVGAFIYFFIERGLFKESFLAIMLHGTLELSMIVIAGCAGFALARGLLFPGTYTRGQALIHSARNGIKILLGVTVLLVYAALIESFATRYTEMPDIIRGGIILISATLVVGYFVIYPRYRHSKGFISDALTEEKPNPKKKDFQLGIIKQPGRLFTETFDLFAKNARITGIISLCATILITISYGIVTGGEFHDIYNSGVDTYFITQIGFLYPWDAFDHHLNFGRYPLIYLVFALLFSGYALFFYFRTNSDIDASTKKIVVADFVRTLFITALIMTPFLLPHSFTFFILPFIFPIGLLWIYVAFIENLSLGNSFSRTFSLLKGNFWRMIGTFMGTLAIQWICYFVLSSDIMGVLVEFINSNIPHNAAMAEEVPVILHTFILFFIPCFMLTLSLYGTALLYHSVRETNEANTLLAAIEKIGFKKRAYGLEQEA